MLATTCKTIASVEKISELISQGNESKALALMYKISFPKIRSMIKKMSGSNDDAKDVFQDVVIKFYRMLVQKEFEKELDAEAYLYTMARNTWLSRIRKDNRSESLDAVTWKEPQETAGDHLYLLQEQKNQILEFFSSLGKRCEELLIMKFYYNYSMKEISERMDFKNEDSAKTQHYKCKQLLIEKAESNPTFKQLLHDAAAGSGY